MYIPHSDPEVDGLFRELSRRCAWTVAFSDSRYICRCRKHGFSLTVATMTKRSQTAGEIRDALIESFHCVGDWG